MKELGSDFHIPVSLLTAKTRNEGNTRGIATWLGSGRDALVWILKALNLPRGSEVLLPAYLCEDVVGPFTTTGLRVRFYGVTNALQIDAADLAKKLSPDTRLLLYINYFGFPCTMPGVFKDLDGPVALIEDASHSWLSSLDQCSADFRFASFRKMLPLPDGSAVWQGNDNAAGRPLVALQSLQHRMAVGWRAVGALTKAVWLQFPGLFPRRVFRQCFAWSEKLIARYPKPAPMSAISRFLLNRLDLDEIRARRRRNFLWLLKNLQRTDEIRPLYSELPEGVCPLGFPILCRDRNQLAHYLIEHRIYTPVHWRLPAEVDPVEFRDAQWVADRILTIPIDQRYDESDMDRILNTLRNYLQGERDKGERVARGALHTRI